ncbi:MAG TPA: class I SAM-dependent methyltransferase [Sorangium sp.]|nr:class I SAM-dependent methyltransferase [Sorangium sp.]
MDSVNLPYFDRILSAVQEEPDSEAVQAFGTRHVHWGYFSSPDLADPSTPEMLAAAEAMSQRMSAIAGVADGARVLDVGCGFGGTIASISERFNNVELVGLNIDGRQLARARELVRPRPGNKIEFVEGDACRLPFPDASFDAVLAVECIFHFSSRRRFFQEARRVLKPGGKLAVSDFVSLTRMLPFTIPLHVANLVNKKHFYGALNPLMFTPWAYRLLAQRSGFHQTLDEDVTPNTVPTYRFMARMANNEAGRAMTRVQEAIAKWGIIRYRLMSFVAA